MEEESYNADGSAGGNVGVGEEGEDDGEELGGQEGGEVDEAFGGELIREVGETPTLTLSWEKDDMKEWTWRIMRGE